MENDYGLDAIKILLRNQQQTYDYLQEKLQTEMTNDQTLNQDFENASSWYQHIYQGEEMVLSRLLRTQRYSTVNTYYSFFEGQLQQICKELSREFTIEIRHKRKGDSDLNRYYKFLSNEYGMNMDSVEHYYNVINAQKIIRNLVTHNQGYVPSWATITEVSGLVIEEIGATKRINIENIYYDYLHSHIYGFLSNIILPLDQRFEYLKR